jgi:hypothetical protein
LTATPSEVKLGGTLLENTTIDKAGFDLNFTGAGNVEILGNAAMGTLTPDASAKLQVDATNQGVLLPRLTQTQMNAIVSPANGLMLYCTDCIPIGFRYYNGANWTALVAASSLNTQTGIVITSTTTAPNTGARSIDQITWEESGNKIRLKYQLGIAGGSGGSGDYLFHLPTGVTFNTAANRNPTLTTGIFSSPNIAACAKYFIPGSGGVIYSGNWTNDIFIVPYSSTTFRVVTSWHQSNALGAWGSGYFAAIVDMSYNFEFEIWK